MKFTYHSFRHALVILQEVEFISQLNEITDILVNIDENDIILQHNSYPTPPKSISVALNHILKERFLAAGWTRESAIFQDTEYVGDTWRLDFAKGDVSIEVGFNHGSVIAWNLLKPVLASELNHVNKALQTKIGVIITATESLKKSGGFDGAVGTYEKYIEYLKPLNNILSVPLLIYGLESPDTFYIEHSQLNPQKKIGRVVMKSS